MNHAVIVAGHAVLNFDNLYKAHRSDQGWYLLSYQKNQGYPEIIASHIKKGIELLQDDKESKSLLLFSGGQTRHDVGPTSEALSYFVLAHYNKWFPNQQLTNRVFLEEYAKDSYENLLFSICRFKEVAGRYPEKITVIGFDFKSHRFKAIHRKAISFPVDHFDYIGLRPGHSSFDHQKAQIGEADAVRDFERDVYGCTDVDIVAKKRKRNPFHRTPPYEKSCPELKELFAWCGPGLFDGSILPWNQNLDQRG
jgi:hypothetical protein